MNILGLLLNLTEELDQACSFWMGSGTQCPHSSRCQHMGHNVGLFCRHGGLEWDVWRKRVEERRWGSSRAMKENDRCCYC